jgi:hypothetical protein
MWRVFYFGYNLLIPFSTQRGFMTGTKATSADAEIVLKLYDLRREAVMREARNWYLMKFWPKSAQDVIDVATGFGTQENSYFRQVVSYWEMSSTLVLQGALHPDLFMDWSGEMVFFFAKIYPYITEVRAAVNPGFWLKVETVIKQTDRQAALEASVERQKAIAAKAK